MPALPRVTMWCTSKIEGAGAKAIVDGGSSPQLVVGLPMQQGRALSQHENVLSW